jgi:hypothetical protein
MADVTVRIAADNSELKSVIDGSTKSVKEMGGSFREASGEVNRAGMEMIRISSHITGEAIPGFSRLSREIASVGAEAFGIGPMLAAAIPIAAIVGGVALMEHFAEAATKVKQANAEWAEGGLKLNEEILQEKERLVGLTQGPLAEAILRTKDLKEADSGLAQVIVEGDKQLDARIGTITNYITVVERAWMTWEKFMHVSNAIPLTKEIVKGREADIKEQYENVQKLTEAMKAYQLLLQDIQKGGGASAPDLTAQVQLDIARVEQLQEKARTKAMVGNAQVADQELKLAKETAAAKEKLEKELHPPQKGFEMPTAEGGVPLIGPDTKANEKMVTEAMTGLATLREETRTQWDEMNDIIAKSLDQRLRYVQENGMLIEQANLKMWDSIKASEQNAMNVVTQNVTSQMMSWMKGQETFKTAALRMWVGIAESAIESYMKQGIAALEALAVGKSTHLQERFENAKTAAGAAYKAEAGIPVVGPVLGAAAAATAFAAVMAFEKGGISGGGLAMLHPREMVLPAKLSDFVQRSAAAITPGDGARGGDTHNNFHIGAINTPDPKDFVDQLKDAVRKGRLRF